MTRSKDGLLDGLIKVLEAAGYALRSTEVEVDGITGHVDWFEAYEETGVRSGRSCDDVESACEAALHDLGRKFLAYKGALERVASQRPQVEPRHGRGFSSYEAHSFEDVLDDARDEVAWKLAAIATAGLRGEEQDCRHEELEFLRKLGGAVR